MTRFIFSIKNLEEYLFSFSIDEMSAAFDSFKSSEEEKLN